MFKQFDKLEKKVQSDKALVFKTSKSFIRKKTLISFLICAVSCVIISPVLFYYDYFMSITGNSIKSYSSLIVILGAIGLFIGLYSLTTLRYSIWIYDREKQTLFIYIKKVLLKVETEISFSKIEGIKVNKIESKLFKTFYHCYLSTTKNNISFCIFSTEDECRQLNECITNYIKNK